jgi:hypothetical protein
MGRREIFHTFLLLVEIVGHFTHEFVSYVYETEVVVVVGWRYSTIYNGRVLYNMVQSWVHSNTVSYSSVHGRYSMV